MKKRHIISTLMAFFGAAVLLTGCGGTPAFPTEQDLPVINIGCDDYPPFSYVDNNGEMTGIDIELAEKAFGSMGYKPVFSIISWENKKELLRSGVIDCIWSSFTIDGREDEYKWAGPYMKSKQVIAVNESSDIYTLDDLNGKLIAVQSTTKPEDILREHKDGLPEFRRVISVKKRDLIFTMLGKGYVDAAAAHITAVEQFMQDCPLKFRILDEPLLTVGLGVAFDKDDERGLDAELGEILDQCLRDGTTEEIIGKYLPDPGYYVEVGSEE